MQNLSSEQAALAERTRAEIRQITNRLNDEVQVLRSREATLEANIDQLKGQMAEYQESEIGLDALQREANADRALLDAKEIAPQKAQEPDSRIISRAVTPDEPTYPRRKLILAMALLAGAAVAVVWLRLIGVEKARGGVPPRVDMVPPRQH